MINIVKSTRDLCRIEKISFLAKQWGNAKVSERMSEHFGVTFLIFFVVVYEGTARNREIIMKYCLLLSLYSTDPIVENFSQ
jgi:hypothetical protein